MKNMFNTIISTGIFSFLLAIMLCSSLTNINGNMLEAAEARLTNSNNNVFITIVADDAYDLALNANSIKDEKTLEKYIKRCTIKNAKMGALYRVDVYKNNIEYNLDGGNIATLTFSIPEDLKGKELSLITYHSNGSTKVLASNISKRATVITCQTSSLHGYFAIVYNGATNSIMTFIIVMSSAILLAVVGKIISLKIKDRKHHKKPAPKKIQIDQLPENVGKTKYKPKG